MPERRRRVRALPESAGDCQSGSILARCRRGGLAVLAATALALALGAGAAQARIDQHQPGAEIEALCQRVLALENFQPEVSVVRPRERLAYRLRLPVQIRQPAWRILDELFVPEAPEASP